MLKGEIDCLKAIRTKTEACKSKHGYDYVPTVIAKGIFLHDLTSDDISENKQSDSS